MKKRIIITLFLLVVISLGVNAAVTTQINMEDSFKVNEKVSFTYSFLSDKDEIIKYVPGIECPTAPMLLLAIREANLKQGELFEEEYAYFDNLPQGIESQTCIARVSTISPVAHITEKEFQLEALPEWDFRLIFCKQEDCLDKTKVFLQGDDVYLNYVSSLETSDVESTLEYPDGAVEEVELPYHIEADQIGAYELRVKAYSEEQGSISKFAQFAAIEKEPDVEIESRCDSDGECDFNENYDTCPQDCEEPTAEEKIEELSERVEEIEKMEEDIRDKQWILFIILAIAIIAYFFIKKPKKGKKKKK